MPSRSKCQRSTGDDARRGRAHHVLLIEPGKLFEIEGRSRFVDIGDVEQASHFLDGEEFLVAVRPAQAHQIIEHGLGQEAFVPIVQHADGAMALRQLGAVGAQESWAGAHRPAAAAPIASSMFICRGVLFK